jgi:hypothetical protein
MSLANILVPNQLSLYCGAVNGYNNTLDSFNGTIIEKSYNVEITTTPFLVYTLSPTAGVNQSFDAVFLICGLCIQGSNLNIGFTQYTRTRVRFIAGVPTYTFAYNGTPGTGVVSYDAFPSPGTPTVGQTVTTSGNSLIFRINADSSAGNTWIWSYDLKILINN